MRVTAKSKYAILSLVYLSRNKERGEINIKEISNEYSISKIYLEQVFSSLKKVHIVDSRKGKGGGYFLSKNEKDISLYDILFPFEVSLLNETIPKQKKTQLEVSQVDNLLNNISKDLNKSLKKITLSSIVEKTSKMTSGHEGMYI